MSDTTPSARPDSSDHSQPATGRGARNRLARETSPYLLQHAGNPVDWYPWGDEALGRARDEDRPILLSIGYSACHWCHVMERESFEDEGTAALMNEHFVNIKVDREERPDLDGIYMRAVQSITGQGGWPLTAFLTPQGLPYYGGTYFPPEPRHGMPSFRQVLEAAGRAYTGRKAEVREAAGRMRGLLERSMTPPDAGRASPGDREARTGLARAACGNIARGYDTIHGGFGRAPKFPQPMVLELMMRVHRGSGDEQLLSMATHTLRKMARGGIHDQLGGGFHRYTVDAHWLVPHFEKMLYDNALLASAYLQAHLYTGDAEFLAVTEKTLAYMLADLRSPEGGFYSARDADSEGEEGLFYLWTAEEVDALLDPSTARLFRRCYDVTPAGNFEGRNILHLPHGRESVASAEGARAGRTRRRARAGVRRSARGPGAARTAVPRREGHRGLERVCDSRLRRSRGGPGTARLCARGRAGGGVHPRRTAARRAPAAQPQGPALPGGRVSGGLRVARGRLPGAA